MIVAAGSHSRRRVRGNAVPWLAAGLAVGLTAGYLRVGRERVLNWGASDVEVDARLPGDELLEDADGVSTRAISIAADPDAVWPWLVQIGPYPRGGAYTYDWIENLLGLDMHSVDRVLSEFQEPEIGETIEFGSNAMRLELCDRPRAVAWRSLDQNWVWLFHLERTAFGTRLLSRNRFSLPTLAGRIGMLLLEPGSLIMERKMLLGIRDRAERITSARGGDG